MIKMRNFLFKQQRVTKGGKIFTIYKLRTMKNGKVTRIGKFLRRWRLDELPQIINIIRGDMALVGVRPLMISEHNALRGYNLPVKAGITGLWQIHGCDIAELNRWDFEYYRKKSLWFDLKILRWSVTAVVRGINWKPKSKIRGMRGVKTVVCVKAVTVVKCGRVKPSVLVS